MSASTDTTHLVYAPLEAVSEANIFLTHFGQTFHWLQKRLGYDFWEEFHAISRKLTNVRVIK